MARPAATSGKRTPLNRDRIFATAIALADEHGIEAVSMRNVAQELDVVPMALYKHVANKDELLDGMIDVVVGTIDPVDDGEWKVAMRRRILAARRAMRAHPWTSQVIESRTDATPAVLTYMDPMIGLFRSGGFSIDLTHHAMHVMGSRLLGFSQELFDDSSTPDPTPEMLEQMAVFPHISELLLAITHDASSVVGPGCDDQFEFEFAVDLLLDGLERRRDLEGSPRGS